MPEDRPISSITSGSSKKMELCGLEIRSEMMEIKANAVTKPTDSFVIVQTSSLNGLLSFPYCPTCNKAG